VGKGAERAVPTRHHRSWARFALPHTDFALPTLRTRLKKTRRSFPATQVGFPDLRIKKPISGRPEIGAQFQPWIFSYTTRAPSSKKRVSRVRIAPGACTALTPERPSASRDIAFAQDAGQGEGIAMPRRPRGEKRPGDVIGAAVMVARIATARLRT